MKLIVSPPVRVVPSGQLTVARVVAGVPLPAAGSNATLSCEVKSFVLYWAQARSWSKPTPAIPPVSVIGWVNWTISTVPGSEANRQRLDGPSLRVEPAVRELLPVQRYRYRRRRPRAHRVRRDRVLGVGDPVYV